MLHDGFRPVCQLAVPPPATGSGKCHYLGAPGPRPLYGETYYAAFLLDPDGNRIEAVCRAAPA
jgi:hypothetical protein